MSKWRLPPALALFIIAPVFGELFSGSAPLNEYINPIMFIVLSLLYGCGAILIRELVILWEKGWASLLLLGFAYGIYEEGLVVRSFFDPNWGDLGNLGIYGRVLGVNWVWTQHLTIYHALISISASIAFVEAFYPGQRRESWLPSRGWWIANWFGLLSLLPLGKLLMPYDAPDIWILLSWLAIVGLVVLARLLPSQIIKPRTSRIHKPPRYWWLGFLGMFGQFIIIYQGADEGAYPFPAAMLILLLYDLFLLWLILRWNGNGIGWDTRHRLALINGALSFFLIFTPLTTNGQYPVMYFSNPIFILWLWWMYRKAKHRLREEQNAAEMNDLNQFVGEQA